MNLLDVYTKRMARDMSRAMDFNLVGLYGSQVPDEYHFKLGGGTYIRMADKRYKNWREAQKWWDNYVEDWCDKWDKVNSEELNK